MGPTPVAPRVRPVAPLTWILSLRAPSGGRRRAGITPRPRCAREFDTAAKLR